MMDDTAAPTGSPSYEIPPHVLFRQVEGQMVLLDLDSERYFGLNEVGADIVNRLTLEPPDVAVRSLAREYDVDPDILRRDVDRLVKQLLDAGLLASVDG